MRRAFSLRITEFSKFMRMFPLTVLVPTAAQLDLRLPSSGRPEQVNRVRVRVTVMMSWLGLGS